MNNDNLCGFCFEQIFIFFIFILLENKIYFEYDINKFCFLVIRHIVYFLNILNASDD